MTTTVDLYWARPVVLQEPSSLAEQIDRDSRSWLDRAERERMARFVRDVDRDLFLLGRYLLRTALAEQTRTDPSDWSFVLGPHGRPRPTHPSLEQKPDANLSHTQGLVVVAVSQHPVGIDVERADRQPPGRRPERFLTPVEIAQWQDAAETDRVQTFWRLWTLKEAWLKALGTGVAGGLQSGSIRLDRLCVDTDSERTAQLTECPLATPEGNFCIGIAARTQALGDLELREHRLPESPGT